MSFKSHLSRAVVGTAVAAAALTATAPAHAAELTLTYKCTYPLLGTQPVTVSLDRGVGGLPPGSPQPITAQVSLGGSFSAGLSLVDGYSSLGGQLALTLGLAIGDAPVEAKVVSLPFQEPRLAAPFSNPVVFTAVGPAIPISAPATVTIDALQPQIAFYNAAGARVDGPGLGPQLDIDSPDYGKRPWKPACTLDAGQTTAFPSADVTPPSTPEEGVLTEADFTPTSINLRWTASTDNPGGSGVKEYIVRFEGQEIRVPAGTLSKRIEGLGPENERIFEISAVDFAGNESAPLELNYDFVIPPPPPIDTIAPSNPVVTCGAVSQTSIGLSWTPAADNVGVVGYDVYRDAVLVSSVTGTTVTISGLVMNTSYAFKVVAKDAAGNRSSGGTATCRWTPPPPPPLYFYNLAGTATLKTLTKGTLPLKGSINANLMLATGTFTADLVLNPTQGRLTALGFLPVTAKIGFVPSGKTTGTLLDGVLKTNSKVRIKVQEVKLFGAIPLAGGNSCQTKSLSDINLRSTQPEFRPLVGGPLAGTFAISDLNGCGALNGLVSPVTAGGGNAINLQLTPGS